MDKFKQNRKAWIAGIGAVLTTLLTLAVDPNVQAVLPQNWQTWLAAGGGAALTAGLAYLRRQQLTPEQVATAVVKGDVTIPEVKQAVAAKVEEKAILAPQTAEELAKRVLPDKPVLSPEEQLYPSRNADELTIPVSNIEGLQEALDEAAKEDKGDA